MSSVISLYIFGGEHPLVSQTTAVAVGIIQVYSLLVGAAVSGVAQPSQKKIDCSDEPDDHTIVSMARHCFACVVANLSMMVKSSIFQRLGGMFAVLMLGRFLRMSGVLTTASQAIPLAFVLGGLLSITAKHFMPQESGNAGHANSGNNCDDYIPSSDKSPYTEAFWSELNAPAANTDPIDKVSLDPTEILSDVFFDLIMK